jgi:5-methylcytosine-specific restriction endonuclease McrA
MPRAVEEWVATHDDQAVPPRVRLRIFDRDGGFCRLTGRKIMAGDQWDLDHIIALSNGGQHRESNLAPVLRSAHREKTKQDVKIKAKIARVRKRHLGIKKPRTITRWRKFDGSVVEASRERS